MGLQGQLSDVSSESIPILIVAIIANCVGYLRSFLLIIRQALGLSRFDSNYEIDHGLFGAVGAGLAGLILLSEQLNLNRAFSHSYEGELGGGCDGTTGLDCVVCLNRFRDGDRVRRLACSHVFHKDCFDGWLESLDQLNFSCPLCRAKLVSEERVELTRRRVGGDLIA